MYYLLFSTLNTVLVNTLPPLCCLLELACTEVTFFTAIEGWRCIDKKQRLFSENIGQFPEIEATLD